MLLQHGDSLICVDCQMDFVSGSLAVPGAADIIPNVVDAIGRFKAQALPIIYTRCWHPPDHCSFKEFGGRWPAHCVQNTVGAMLVDEVRLGAATVISKGTLAEKDAYSGFDGTELHEKLRELDIKRVFTCGLATNFCVLATTLDSLKLGYQTILLGDAIAGVPNVEPSPREAMHEMYKAGAIARETRWISKA